MQRNLYLDHDQPTVSDVTEDDGVRGLEGELHHGGEVLGVAAARVLQVQRHPRPAHLELCREGMIDIVCSTARLSIIST